jgi:hypothetical protein
MPNGRQPFRKMEMPETGFDLVIAMPMTAAP